MPRYVLDTCVVRNIIHNDSSQLDSALILSDKTRFQISVGEPAAVELMVALIQGGISWDLWSTRISVLNTLLDPIMPMLPGANELAYMAHLTSVRPVIKGGTFGYYRGLWNHLVRATSIADLERPFVYYDEKGGGFRAYMKYENALRVAALERDRWIKWFMQAKIKFEGIEDSATRRELIREDLRYDLAGQPGFDVAKLEAIVSVLARFVDLLFGTTPYNPEAERRKGDVFDFALIFALSLPAYIITADGRLKGHVRDAGHPDHSSVLSVEEFNALKSQKC